MCLTNLYFLGVPHRFCTRSSMCDRYVDRASISRTLHRIGCVCLITDTKDKISKVAIIHIPVGRSSIAEQLMIIELQRGNRTRSFAEGECDKAIGGSNSRRSFRSTGGGKGR